jgi:hypothetical protein
MRSRLLHYKFEAGAFREGSVVLAALEGQA